MSHGRDSAPANRIHPMEACDTQAAGFLVGFDENTWVYPNRAHKKGPARGPLDFSLRLHLQLDGRYLEGIEPPQAQDTWPLAALVPVKVMLAPSMAELPVPLATAVMMGAV